MKFNSDCYIQGTKLHPICEDYALAIDEEKHSFIIVCDGCSTSVYTDIGARILAHTVKNEFLNHQKDILPWHTHIFSPLNKALKISQDLQIVKNKKYSDFNPLLTTILFCFNFGKNFYIKFYGDGYLVVEFIDGDIQIYEANYSMNAPYYPIYEISDIMRKNFIDQFGEQEFKITQTSIFTDNRIVSYSYKLSQYSPAAFTFNISKIKNISILSDGVSSFWKTGIQTGYHIYNTIDVIKKIIDWRSCSGPFVLRRCKRLLNTEMPKEDYYNTDDFSIATIHVDHEEGA